MKLLGAIALLLITSIQANAQYANDVYVNINNTTYLSGCSYAPSTTEEFKLVIQDSWAQDYRLQTQYRVRLNSIPREYISSRYLNRAEVVLAPNYNNEHIVTDVLNSKGQRALRNTGSIYLNISVERYDRYSGQTYFVQANDYVSIYHNSINNTYSCHDDPYRPPRRDPNPPPRYDDDRDNRSFCERYPYDPSCDYDPYRPPRRDPNPPPRYDDDRDDRSYCERNPRASECNQRPPRRDPNPPPRYDDDRRDPNPPRRDDDRSFCDRNPTARECRIENEDPNRPPRF